MGKKEKKSQNLSMYVHNKFLLKKIHKICLCMCIINFCIYGECTQRILAHKENACKEFWRKWSIRRNILCGSREGAKRISV